MTFILSEDAETSLLTLAVVGVTKVTKVRLRSPPVCTNHVDIPPVVMIKS